MAALGAIINYQQITRRRSRSRIRTSAKLRERSSVSFYWTILPRRQAFTETRYSRSVLINRLFMFNAVWYSDTRKFSKLSDGERDCDRNRWVGAETSNKGMLLHRGDVCETSQKKKSRETAESSSRIGPAFCHLPRRRSLGHGIPSHVCTKTSRVDLRRSSDRLVVSYSRASKVLRVPRGYRPSWLN